MRVPGGSSIVRREPNTTIVSVDGVSAYDTISREAMEVSQCCLSLDNSTGRVSQYLWEDDAGVISHDLPRRGW